MQVYGVSVNTVVNEGERNIQHLMEDKLHIWTMLTHTHMYRKFRITVMCLGTRCRRRREGGPQ